MSYILKIVQDENPMSPREWDQITTFFFPKKSRLGGINENESCKTATEFLAWKEENKEEILIILPVYAYIHSGIALSLGKFSCPWDSGQVGWVYITKEKYKMMQGDNQEHNNEKMLTQFVEGEIEEMNKWFSGDVWAYKVVEVCDHCGHEVGLVDSCFGFYDKGDCEQEGKNIMKHFEEKQAKEDLCIAK